MDSNIMSGFEGMSVESGIVIVVALLRPNDAYMRELDGLWLVQTIADRLFNSTLIYHISGNLFLLKI